MDKDFEVVGFKNQRRTLRQLPQTQKNKVNIIVDSRKHAILPGKRVSKTGKIYWETRKNRSDVKGKNI